MVQLRNGLRVVAQLKKKQFNGKRYEQVKWTETQQNKVKWMSSML